MMLVDNASAFNPQIFARDVGTIVRHPDPSSWGENFCLGLKYAEENNYEWFVCVETGVLLMTPVLKFLEKICRSGVLAAGAYDGNILFLSVPFANSVGLIRKLVYGHDALSLSDVIAAVGSEFFYIPMQEGVDFRTLPCNPTDLVLTLERNKIFL